MYSASGLLPRVAPRGYLTKALAHEFDAARLAATPNHLAGPTAAGIARECQPQLGGQRVVVLDRDLGARRRDVLDHAGPRGESAIQRDPPGLAQRFAHLALLGPESHRIIPKAQPYRPWLYE